MGTREELLPALRGRPRSGENGVSWQNVQPCHLKSVAYLVSLVLDKLLDSVRDKVEAIRIYVSDVLLVTE